MRIDSLSGGGSDFWVMQPRKVMRGQRIKANPLAKKEQPSFTTQPPKIHRVIQPKIDQNGRLIAGNHESSIGNFVDVYS